VISLPLSSIVIEIRQLLANIKTNELTELDSKRIAPFFLNLDQQQVNNLASGFFGIYVDPATLPITRQNIHYLCPHLWTRVDEDTRQIFGIKYGKFVANSDKEREINARHFLEAVNGISYMPENIKIVEIETAIQNLLTVHGGINNFYNEPTFARQLHNIIGQGGVLPKTIRKTVVLGIVKVFLTNGNGVASAAEPYYIEMIKKFNQAEALLALLSFFDEQIASSLQFSLCKIKYDELLGLLKGKLSISATKELFEEIKRYSGKLDSMRNDSRIKRMAENVQIILNE
jgi:hypothetical protein